MKVFEKGIDRLAEAAFAANNPQAVEAFLNRVVKLFHSALRESL